MKQGDFYFYQVVTGNLSRIITHAEEYKMLIESYKKTNLDEAGKEELVRLEIELQAIENKKDVYLKIKEELDNKYFGKYFRPSFIDVLTETIKMLIERYIK